MPSNRDLKVSMEGDRKEETVVEGIDTPSWNTELATVSSRILSVWSQIYSDAGIAISPLTILYIITALA